MENRAGSPRPRRILHLDGPLRRGPTRRARLRGGLIPSIDFSAIEECLGVNLNERFRGLIYAAVYNFLSERILQQELGSAKKIGRDIKRASKLAKELASLIKRHPDHFDVLLDDDSEQLADRIEYLSDRARRAKLSRPRGRRPDPGLRVVVGTLFEIWRQAGGVGNGFWVDRNGRAVGPVVEGTLALLARLGEPMPDRHRSIIRNGLEAIKSHHEEGSKGHR